MRKLIYALTAGALLMLGATAAHADYNTVSGSVGAGGSATTGSSQTFSAGGFKVGTSVEFILHSDPIDLGSAVADSTGTATGTFTIPANTPPGEHTVSAQGVDPAGNARVVSSGSFRVLPAAAVLGSTQSNTNIAAARGRTAARTGASNTVPLTIGGATLVAAGAGLVTIARRRRIAVPATA